MIKVVARNIVQEHKLDEVIEMYKELVSLSRNEKGCISYELYQDKSEPTILTMIEEWESPEALKEHFKTEHFIRIVAETKKYMLSEKPDLNIYNKLI